MESQGVRRNKELPKTIDRQFKYNGHGWTEESQGYEIRKPFGPSLYIGKFTDDEITFLQKLSKEAQTKSDPMGQSLSGNIAGQYDLKSVGTPEEQNRFINLMAEHCNNYIRSGLQVSNLDEMPSEDEHDLAIELLGYPWVNVTKAGEFNPMHTHPNSLISASLYIDIPEVIKQEKDTAKEYTNQPVPGDITFTGGLIDDIWQSSGINYTPTTGDAIFFPGAMRHAVYPFKSDVERVTLSFNIAQFGFVKKESNEAQPYKMWFNDHDR